MQPVGCELRLALRGGCIVARLLAGSAFYAVLVPDEMTTPVSGAGTQASGADSPIPPDGIALDCWPSRSLA